MATVILRPMGFPGFGASGTWVDSATGTTPVDCTSIDDDPTTGGGTDYWNLSAYVGAIGFVDLHIDNMPADAGVITNTVTRWVHEVTGWVNDTAVTTYVTCSINADGAVGISFGPSGGYPGAHTNITKQMFSVTDNTGLPTPKQMNLTRVRFDSRATSNMGADAMVSRWYAFDVEVTYDVPAITQAAYQFFNEGTQSGSTSLAAVNTPPAIDISSGDVNMQLRTRLQSTTAVAIPADNDFRLQWEKNASGTWTDVSVGSALADSYSSENQSYYLAFGYSGTSARAGAGQTFMGNGAPITRVGFLLSKSATLAGGNVTAKLWSHSGTYGSSGVGATLLQTSTTSIAANSVTETVTSGQYGWYYFDFPGTYTLENGTPYVITLECDTLTSNNLYLGTDNTGSSSHGGNVVYYESAGGGTWGFSYTTDLIFEVHTGSPNSPVMPYASANLTDAAATTNRLGAGSGSFVAGKVSQDHIADNVGWSANNYTELLYSIKLGVSHFTNGDTLRFRVLRNGLANLTYTQTPQLTLGISTGAGSVSGAFTYSGSVTGSKFSNGAVTGAVNYVGTVSGTNASPPKTGEVTGAVDWAGSVTGSEPAGGAVTGAVSYVGTVTGFREPKGETTGAISWVGVVTGGNDGVVFASSITWVGTVTGQQPTVAPKEGAVNGAVGWVGSITGSEPAGGTVTGAITYVGSVTGSEPAGGAVNGAVGWAGTVNGSRPAGGAIDGVITWGAGVVVGANLGVVIGAVGWAGSVTGARQSAGSVAGAVDWAGTVDGVSPGVNVQDGSVTGAISWAGSVTGSEPAGGAVAGAIGWSGAVTGARNSQGAVNGALTWGAGVVVGANLGVIIGAIQWAGTVTGARQSSGDISGSVAWVGSVNGEKSFIPMPEGVVSGNVEWAGTIVGEIQPVGELEGAISWGPGSIIGPAITVVVGFIAGNIGGPGVSQKVFLGPLLRRSNNGPEVSRSATGPELVIEAINGPANVFPSFNGPDTRRALVGPDVSHTVTGPDT